MESKVIDSEQLNFSGKSFARLSYEMLFEDQDEGEGEERSLETAVESISKEELTERLRKAEEQWQKRLEEEKEKTARAAYKRGRNKGRKEAESAIDEKVSGLKAALEEADRKIGELMDELKPVMAQMVFDLAEKVVRVPVADKEIRRKVSDEIVEILEELEENIRVKIHVSKEDYELVSKELEECGDKIELKASEELNPGEYTVDTRKERVVKRFTKILNDFKESVALTDDKSYDEVA